MAWVKLDDGFPEHPIIDGLSDAAFRLHVAGLCFCSRQLTDGLIPAATVVRLVPKHQPKAVTELVEAGRWLPVDGGYQLHDYLKYQPSREQVEARREKARERMNFARTSQEVRANSERSSDSVRITPARPVPTPISKNSTGSSNARPPEPSLQVPSLEQTDEWLQQHRQLAEEAVPMPVELRRRRETA